MTKQDLAAIIVIQREIIEAMETQLCQKYAQRCDEPEIAALKRQTAPRGEPGGGASTRS